MRAQTAPLPPTLPIDKLTAQKLIEDTRVAISQKLSQLDQADRKFLNSFYDNYKNNLKVEDLVDKTLDQANTHIKSVIFDAERSAESDFDTSFKKPRRDEAAADLKSIVAEAASNVLQLKGQKPIQFVNSAIASQLVQATKDAISKSAQQYKFANDYVAEIQNLYKPRQSALEDEQATDAVNTILNTAGNAAEQATAYPFSDTSTPKD